jgi:hypothetical protein
MMVIWSDNMNGMTRFWIFMFIIWVISMVIFFIQSYMLYKDEKNYKYINIKYLMEFYIEQFIIMAVCIISLFMYTLSLMLK